MQCIRPLKASLDSQRNITFKKSQAIPGLIGFEFECRKCLACRLNQAREKAIRATHEAKMHENNIFLTLTYNDESLTSPKLQYIDFVLFMKKLRKHINKDIKDKETLKKIQIDRMVTGEYGEQNKRPHWHAIIFNYFPEDAKKHYQTQLKEQVYTSEILDKIWSKGKTEFGSVTMESAGYVARYAAKKLVHGKDQDHEYHPIHKTPSLRGMGRSWIEKYYEHTFQNGFIVLPNGQQSKIPRYYTDWVKKNKPELYTYYITEVRPTVMKLQEEKNRQEELEHLSNLISYKGGSQYPLKKAQVKDIILQQKFKKLQENLKI